MREDHRQRGGGGIRGGGSEGRKGREGKGARWVKR